MKYCSGIILIILTVFSSCKKSEEVIVIENSLVKLHFNNVVGDEEMILDSGVYMNYYEQIFKVAKFNYFISNIELIRQDGSSFIIPRDSSYFLIKEKDLGSHTFTLKEIPPGLYSGIKYLLGVDSLKSTANISERFGTLDPAGYAADMYWTWNQGYIFMKLECHQVKSRGDTTFPIPYVYHIGGFGGMNQPTINNLKTIQLMFPNTLEVKANNVSEIHIKADALKVLTGSTNIDFNLYPTVMLTTFSMKVAENQQQMFSIEQIK